MEELRERGPAQEMANRRFCWKRRELWLLLAAIDTGPPFLMSTNAIWIELKSEEVLIRGAPPFAFFFFRDFLYNFFFFLLIQKTIKKIKKFLLILIHLELNLTIKKKIIIFKFILFIFFFFFCIFLVNFEVKFNKKKKKKKKKNAKPWIK